MKTGPKPATSNWVQFTTRKRRGNRGHETIITPVTEQHNESKGKSKESPSSPSVPSNEDPSNTVIEEVTIDTGAQKRRVSHRPIL